MSPNQLEGIALPPSEETAVKTFECDLTNPVLNDKSVETRGRPRKTKSSVLSDSRSQSPYSRKSVNPSRSKSRLNTNKGLPKSKNTNISCVENFSSKNKSADSVHVQPESVILQKTINNDTESRDTNTPPTQGQQTTT